jgi:oxygen-independent coproporphyrinogen-3 oxidase
MTASLYIHIPFCASLCDYCDFFSVPVNAQNDVNVINTFIDNFINNLLTDIEEQFALFGVDHVPTAYIGGGTPSVLGAARMERLLAGLWALLKPLKKMVEEFTVEANPESADEAFLRVCASGGVDRVSLGVQTFHDPSRRAVCRIGDGALVEERLALAARYFPGAFSVDLITGLPFQTEAIVREDIERALALGPGHISLYSLTLEPQTPLGERVTRHGEAALSLPCGDEADALWIAGRDALEKAGFAQYEVSSFGLPGKTCAHNIRYWRMENWLGAGPAASGTIIDDETGTGRRFTYPPDIGGYIAAPNISHGGTEDTEDTKNTKRIQNFNTPWSPCLGVRNWKLEELNRDSLIRETLLMGFRYRGGPEPVSFKRRFGCTIEECIPQTVSRWRERGFFDTDHSDLAPSPNGLLFLNAFLRDAFGELESLKTSHKGTKARREFTINE